MSNPSSACETSGAAIIDAIAIILSMILTSTVSAVILKAVTGGGVGAGGVGAGGVGAPFSHAVITLASVFT